MPRFKSAQDVPLLVVYSSELECEKYFAFWCACRAGKVCHVIEATDNNGIPSPPCIAFERAVLAKPISEVLWLKIDIHSGGHTPEALESQVIRTYKLREGCDIVAVTCPLCCVHVCVCLCVCVWQLIACLRGLCSSCPSQPSLAVTPIVDYLSTSKWW